MLIIYARHIVHGEPQRSLHDAVLEYYVVESGPTAVVAVGSVQVEFRPRVMDPPILDTEDPSSEAHMGTDGKERGCKRMYVDRASTTP